MNRKTNIIAASAMSLMVVTGFPAYAGSSPAILVAPPTVEEAQGLQREGYFDESAAAWLAIVEDDPENGTAWFNLGYSLHAAGHVAEAVPVHQKAATFDRFRGIALYNLGCAHALLGDKDAAFEALAASAKAGFELGGGQAENDPDLKSLRDDSRYHALLASGGDTPWESADESASQSGNPFGGGMGGAMSMFQSGNMEQLFQTVATHMQPIFQELAPQVEQRVGQLVQQAMMHAQELMGMFQQRVQEDEELVAAIQEIYTTLQEDPQFAGLMAQAEQWIGQQMGGGGPPTATSAPDRPSAVVRETPSSAPSTAPAQSSPAPSLADAQQLQNAGRFAEAAEAYGIIAAMNADNGPANFGYAYNLHMSGAHEAAIEAHKAASKFDQFNGIALYNLGCAYALTGRTAEAIKALEASADAGFDVGGNMGSDADFASIRDDERFKRLQSALGGG